MKEGHCLECGAPFQANHLQARRRYCGDPCRIARNTRMDRERRAARAAGDPNAPPKRQAPPRRTGEPTERDAVDWEPKGNDTGYLEALAEATETTGRSW